MPSKYTNHRYLKPDTCNHGCPFDPPCDPRYRLRCELSDKAAGVEPVQQYKPEKYQREFGHRVRAVDDPFEVMKEA